MSNNLTETQPSFDVGPPAAEAAADTLTYTREDVVLAGLAIASGHHERLRPGLSEEEEEHRRRILERARSAL